MVASVPELTSLTCSIEGTSLHSSSAISSSASVGAPKVKPFLRRCLYRFNHFGMGMAKNQRTPGADIIYIGFIVRIPYIGALVPAGKIPAYRPPT